MKKKSQKRKKSWFQVKGYPHIGYPITVKDKGWVSQYVKDSNKIASHAFLPFIHKTIVSKKYRKVYDKNGLPQHNGKPRALKPKVRPIYYAGHLDAQIYSYYAKILNEKYEIFVQQKNLGEVVTAYRTIPLADNSRNKCNIDFANDVFTYIKDNTEKDLVAITFDIKGFFDNLNHKVLKQAWYKILQKPTLPNDHYNVFKSIIKFPYIEEKELFNLFKDKIIVKTESKKIKTKKVKRIEYLKNNGAIAYCEKKDIHLVRKKGLIYNNQKVKKDGEEKLRDFGICQGSPISAILANIYMLEFDEYINNETINIGGIYRRYSDDMVIVCSKKHKKDIITLFHDAIENFTKLEIQDSKTQIFHFDFIGDRLHCSQEFKDGSLNRNRNFEYLGFSFDGKYTYLKAVTLTNYYRKMRTGVKRGIYYLNEINNDTNGELFKRRLYKRYSHIGAKRGRKYSRVKGTTNQWEESHHYNWGNFITYAYLASDILDDNKVRSQVKNHWEKLQSEIEKVVSPKF